MFSDWGWASDATVRGKIRQCSRPFLGFSIPSMELVVCVVGAGRCGGGRITVFSTAPTRPRPQLPAIDDLERVRGAVADALRTPPGTISADHRDLGRAAQQGGDGPSVQSGQQVDRCSCLEVRHDGGSRHGSAECEVVDTKDGNFADGSFGYRPDCPQQGAPADADFESAGESGAGRPAAAKSIAWIIAVSVGARRLHHGQHRYLPHAGAAPVRCPQRTCRTLIQPHRCRSVTRPAASRKLHQIHFIATERGRHPLDLKERVPSAELGYLAHKMCGEWSVVGFVNAGSLVWTA